MDEHLASMTEEERQEVRAFLARFNEQADMKVEQLLYGEIGEIGENSAN
jgi:hypothetical protein